MYTHKTHFQVLSLAYAPKLMMLTVVSCALLSPSGSGVSHPKTVITTSICLALQAIPSSPIYRDKGSRGKIWNLLT